MLGVIVTTASGLIEILIASVAVHPAGSVAVTVTVAAPVAVAVTLEPVVEERVASPVTLQVRLGVPLLLVAVAVSTVSPPEQTLAEDWSMSTEMSLAGMVTYTVA